MGVAIKKTLASGTVVLQDVQGHIISAQTKDGTVANYADSKMTSMVRPNGTRAEYVDGNIDHAERDDGTFVKYENNKIDFFRDDKGNEIHYDEHGKIISVLDADGNLIKFDDKGHVSTIIDASHRRAEFDKDGNLKVSNPVFNDKDTLIKTMQKNAKCAYSVQRMTEARMLGIATNADYLKRSLDVKAQNITRQMMMKDNGR